MNTSRFFKLEDFKIENNGIWISKYELERLRIMYDSEYTNLFNTKFQDDKIRISSLEKCNTKYRIAKELSSLIDND